MANDVGVKSFALAAVMLAMATLSGCGESPESETYTYFRVETGDPVDAFVIALADPAKIAMARAISHGTEKNNVHVMGTVVPEPKSYNAPWQFHMAPDSVEFFELAMEVCDASTTHLNENLDQIGGAFLPNAHWCPWASLVVAEIEVPNTD